MIDKNPYRTLHARMSPPGAAWDEGFAAGQSQAWDSAQVEIDAILASEARPASVGRVVAFLREPRDSTDVNLSLAVAADLIEREFAAGRAAATPDPDEPCSDCDGQGHYTSWPHTTCPTCGGVGRVPSPDAKWSCCGQTFAGTPHTCPSEDAAATPDPPDESHAVKCAEARGYARGRFERDPAASPDPPDLPALDEGPLAYLLEDSAASPDERLREALREIVNANDDEGPAFEQHNDSGGFRYAPAARTDDAIDAARDLLAAADRDTPDADMQAAMDRADEELRAELDAPLVSDDPVPDPETNT